MKIALFVLSLAMAAAHAQPVYKCSVNDVISYGDQPCASGAASTMSMPATPESNAATLARQQRMSEQLAATRHRREAQESREQKHAAKLAAARQKQCAALTLRHTWAEQDAASATGSDAARRKLKARRAAEKLASACPA